jgi:hypothetical protein
MPANNQWFDDFPVAGALPPDELTVYLRQIGDNQTADKLEAAIEDADNVRGPATYRSSAAELIAGLLGYTLPWQHTAHSFGYFPPADGMEPVPLVHAGGMTADASLKNTRLNVHLQRLRVADYPGGGEHNILFDFYAQNQATGTVENLHFNATFRGREGQQVALINYPIFIGLTVGANGVAFRILTVNVSNARDDAMLKFLDSDAFKGGLKLVQAAQPALVPLSEMAYGLTRSLLEVNKDKPIQNIHMGLDFTNISGGARLAVGSYIAVQIPENLQAVWDWRDYVYNPHSGQVVSKADMTQMIAYNYLVFSVSKYEE